MRKILSFIFILLTFITAEANTFKVKGILQNCETKSHNRKERHLSVLLKDSVIIKNVKTVSGEFTIKGLNENIYTFQFTNIFGQIVKKEINISKNNNAIILCVEEFQENNEMTFIESLKPNDTLSFEIILNSSTQYKNEKIIFFHENEILKAELYIENKLMKKIIINSAFREYIMVFEKKLKQINKVNGGCTGSELFIVILNNEKGYSSHDNTCEWNGYHKLKEKFFD